MNLNQLKKLFLITIFLAVAAAGCSKGSEEKKQEVPQSAPALKSGNGIGIVEKISADKKFITLDHKTIPGIMEGMSMQYPVGSPGLLEGIREKDSVFFTLTKTPESQYMVTAIHKR